MSRTWDALVNASTAAKRLWPAQYAEQSPDEIARAELAQFDTILAALKRHPMADRMRIFGSVQNSPDQIPGDIDVFLDMREFDAVPGVAMLLRHTRQHWPYLDPFLLTAQGLWCRSAADRGSDVGWTLVQKNIEALERAGAAGLPVKSFTRRFADMAPPPLPTAPIWPAGWERETADAGLSI